jgi:hypothetical protein
MNFHCRKIRAWCGIALLSGSANAQPTPPHLGFIYPAGGQQGTTITVSVGGQNLSGASGAIVSGTGTQVRVVGYERPLTQKEINDLREESDRLQEKRAAARADSTRPAFGADDEKRVSEIRQLLATRGNRQVAPAIAETVTLEITLGATAVAGDREVRVRTPGGLSNPLVFSIGQLPEIATPVVTSTSARSLRDRSGNAASSRRSSAVEVTLPAFVNGQILPGEVDRFRFIAKRGQRLTFAVSARALMPYLADAVPGWFQATLGVFDPQGRELAYADDYRFAPDPVLSCEIPADGVYVFEIKDALFRGREDFVYRIAAGELPFITSVFPLGGAAGSRTRVALSGWNLPKRELEIDARDRPPGTLLLAVMNEGRFSNSVRFAVASGADCSSAEPNDSFQEAQEITLPANVNGRMDRAGDEDWYRFSGRAGDAIVAEISARRLGSPLDSVLTLLDATGRPLATNDDAEDKGTGLLTHHADSRINFSLPVDGSYFVRVADAQRQGGPEHGYRLRVGAPQPDFELRVVPSTINLRAGATVPITVYALRRDGFAGEIALALVQPPAGFALSGARIPANVEKVTLTLTAPTTGRDDTLLLRLAGRAMVGDQSIARGAVPADDLMQAFAYRHLVPAHEFPVCVVGRGSTLRAIERTQVRLVPGETTRVRVALPPSKRALSVAFELVEPPPGIVVRSVSCRGDVAEITLGCDPAAAKPGTQGNLIFQAFGERPNATPTKAGARPQRLPLGIVPALAFEIAGVGVTRL